MSNPPAGLAGLLPAAAQVKYLLDVNAIIAAVTVNHPDHKKADAWVQGKKIVTCPLSELGFLRIATHPKALKLNMSTARQMLAAFTQKHQVEFLPADLPALNSTARKSEEVTDLYLADLAASRGMKLATLDQAIRHSAVEAIA